MFIQNEDRQSTPCEPGVSRKVLCFDEHLMMCEITFQKGAQGNMHAHPHRQITYVARGSFRFTIADETRTVKQGDSILIPPDAVHGVKALEDGILIDVFSPMRQEFV